MGIPIKRGRVLTEQDQQPPTGEHAMVIDEELAQQYWPNDDPIGKQVVRIFKYRIVGVVGHAMHFGLNTERKGTLYYSANERGIAQGQILVKTTGDPNQLTPAIRKAVQATDSRLAVDGFLSLEDAVAGSLAPRRFGMQLIAFFAATGLFLAALGLYGVISFQVSQRTREIGIRMALGAERRSVLGMVVGQGLRLAAIGAFIGLVVAVASGKWISSQLYQVSPSDPVTLVSMVAMLVVAAVLASYLPARRAVRIDPAVALRPE
jgi:predicted permease